MERSWGTVIANVSPDMFLTKICMVSTGSGDTDLEIGVEETILMVLCGVRDGVGEDETMSWRL